MSIIKAKDTISIPTHLNLTDFIFNTSNAYNPCFKNWDLNAFIDSESQESISNFEMRNLVHELASGLVHHFKLQRGDVLLIFAPNHIHYATLLLAATSIGVIVTTTNPNYTDSELVHQLEHSNAKLIFTVPEQMSIVSKALSKLKHEIQVASIEKEGFKTKHTAVIGLNQLKAKKEYSKLIFKDQEEIKSTPAMIVYSSGTTGLPKGVVLTHYNLISNVLQTESLSRGAHATGRVTIGVLPYYHCYGIVTLLLVGVHNHMITVNVKKFNFVKLLESVQKFKIETMYLAPPIILGLAKSPEVTKYDLSSLKAIVSGAAPLSIDTAKLAKKRLNVHIGQGYGMSELTPVTSLLPLSSDNMSSAGLLCPNIEAKIIDADNGNLLNVGERGELWVKGPNVMLGYLNNPKATKQTIAADGFLRTGDVGHFDKDGYLYITDRIKELIKYKGNQVAPAELEDILLSHSKVLDCCVIGIPNEEAGELPKAYIVLSETDAKKIELEVNEIRKFTHQKLAPYKYLRGGIEVIGEIPKSPAGKILRRVLRDMHLKKHGKNGKL